MLLMQVVVRGHGMNVRRTDMLLLLLFLWLLMLRQRTDQRGRRSVSLVVTTVLL